MLSVQSFLLITMAASAIMLLTLVSLRGGKVRGVKEWTMANLLAVFALILYAGRNSIPDVVSIDLANVLYLSAGALLLFGFSRHVSLRVPKNVLISSVAVAWSCTLLFHYGSDSVAWRTVVVSAFHGGLCMSIALVVYRKLGQACSRYAHLFSVVTALTLACLHAIRAATYVALSAQPVNYLELSAHNVVFLSIGTLALPSLTLGAVMMANAEIIHRAIYAAEHDFLTGAWSRRAFFRIADREHALASAKGKCLSLLVFDVDHFKQVNDTYGHAAGDQVLSDIVCAASACIRSGDICARMGGEEFAVLLPDTGMSTARVIGERLRSSLEKSVLIEPEKVRLTYTVSIGVATLQADETVHNLLRRADAALYAAKLKGRNISEYAGVDNHSVIAA